MAAAPAVPKPSPEPPSIGALRESELLPAAASEPLPLWVGPETEAGRLTGDPEPADSDILANSNALQEAWQSAVLPDGGTTHNFLAALEDELGALQRALSPVAAPALTVPSIPQQEPQTLLDDEDRWSLLQRCLTDETCPWTSEPPARSPCSSARPRSGSAT
ncbi:hypothetical protein ACFCZ1_32740 [Streptomyces sp. NPDC056224]|uniref:hypothetical protein n=1 Tax=Streptomyces sp. NPDC056224 TaxID=3345750 RepID=UPI0035DB6CD7